ncbi:MAG: hypothetical protein ABSE08_10575 [Syntrophobacteraceae bacterium]|jgi:hypothetical protein
MERELKTKEELLKILNEELKKVEDSEGYRFDSIGFKLIEPDSEGCNWSSAVFHGSGVHCEPMMPIVDRIIQEARRKYNLK